MMKNICIFLITLTAFTNCKAEDYLGGVPGTGEWDGFMLDSLKSPMDSAIQKFYFYKSTQNKMPLVISLHQWSSSYKTYSNSLAPQTKEKNWNYVRPDFRGPNNNPKACGSEYVISDIDQIIDWAVENLDADAANIYIVGASGGGYTALCHLMESKTKYRIKEYSVWVPIADLRRWYYESRTRGSKYAGDIIKCTNPVADEPDFQECNKRSPIYDVVPTHKLKYTKVNMYAGIHDGFTGAVPIAHTLLMYNKLVKAVGGATNQLVSCDDINWMLTTRSAPQQLKDKIGNRELLYYNTCENLSISIFEGGHEILVDTIL